jgi:hypothetical protein
MSERGDLRFVDQNTAAALAGMDTAKFRGLVEGDQGPPYTTTRSGRRRFNKNLVQQWMRERKAGLRNRGAGK